MAGYSRMRSSGETIGGGGDGDGVAGTELRTLSLQATPLVGDNPNYEISLVSMV